MTAPTKAPDESFDIDMPPELYARRKKIYPKAVTGFFRALKWRIMIVTLMIYYLTPWIRWERGAGMPDQAVLVDLANRRFYFFFIEIWPQEFYLVAGLLVMAGLGLFLITSVIGRAWCGYFCPQTVWTDLFLHVERFIEGDRNAQMRLDRQGWTAGKIAKRVAKHAIWLIIAAATGGAWVFYFADAPTLAVEIFTGQAAFVAYGSIAVLTFTTYALGGLMREQVCIYMCPWPRIQGAMVDQHSLIVTYNDWRGEPRGKHRKAQRSQATERFQQKQEPVLRPETRPQEQPDRPGGLGDCIDCNACVNVCPTGVDIRDGQQLGCITCALCIDACDEMMGKMNLAKGLISYSTMTEYDDAVAGAPITTPLWKRLLRPRTIVYGGLWAGIGLALVAALVMRDRMDIAVRHDRNPVYVTLSDGSIRNGYTVSLANMRLEERVFAVAVNGLPENVGLRVAGVPGATERDGRVEIPVPANEAREARLYVTLPYASVSADRMSFKFVVDDLTLGESIAYDAPFFAPYVEDTP